MTRVHALLADMRRSASEGAVPILRPECEKILVDVVREKRPVRLLEIGTAIGYSTLLISASMPESATLVTLELDAERAAIAKQHIADAGFTERVTVLVGDALTMIDQLTGDFDFVFLDGPKGQYLAYLQLLLNKLAPVAVVVADNVLFRGMVNSEENPPRRYRTLVKRLREYLAFVSTDERFATTLLSDGDGVAISYYREHRGESDEET
ncbi:MAG: O-methyltransferase family 3 [Anaerosporomusa subterranea]|nr:O-methyltransferase family 3 [Anaerosporomusa subterranea]